MFGRQTGGEEINQTVIHFGPILLTNNSCNTKQTSEVYVIAFQYKKVFVAQLNNKCANASKLLHSGVTFLK